MAPLASLNLRCFPVGEECQPLLLETRTPSSSSRAAITCSTSATLTVSKLGVLRTRGGVAKAIEMPGVMESYSPMVFSSNNYFIPDNTFLKTVLNG